MFEIEPASPSASSEYSPCVNLTPKESPETPLGKDYKPRKCCLPKTYPEFAERIYNFEVRSDDVFIITFSRCGTTWSQEMLWLIENDLDYSTAKSEHLMDRTHYLEIGPLWPQAHISSKQDIYGKFENVQKPRIIKTHLPVQFLPKEVWTKKPKIIYVARNPKDVIVSLYYHFRNIGYKRSFEELADAFLSGDILYGTFWEHVSEYWKIKDDANIFFTTYETMKKDLKDVIRKECDYLGKSLTEDQIDKLADHLSFDNMKKNKTVNNEELTANARIVFDVKETTNFIRKGKVGSYKEELSEEYIKKFDAAIEDLFKNCGFKFEDV